MKQKLKRLFESDGRIIVANGKPTIADLFKAVETRLQPVLDKIAPYVEPPYDHDDLILNVASVNEFVADGELADFPQTLQGWTDAIETEFMEEVSTRYLLKLAEMDNAKRIRHFAKICGLIVRRQAGTGATLYKWVFTKPDDKLVRVKCDTDDEAFKFLYGWAKEQGVMEKSLHPV